jgi:hypothetical protein
MCEMFPVSDTALKLEAILVVLFSEQRHDPH